MLHDLLWFYIERIPSKPALVINPNGMRAGDQNKFTVLGQQNNMTRLGYFPGHSQNLGHIPSKTIAAEAKVDFKFTYHLTFMSRRRATFRRINNRMEHTQLHANFQHTTYNINLKMYPVKLMCYDRFTAFI